MASATKVWDVADHLKTERDMASYLEACLEERDSELVALALDDIARAKAMHRNATLDLDQPPSAARPLTSTPS
ncbi:DNA-binding protein [Cupriavidus gilardii]|uniref:DNA-binding protein n=1 Tax=Cupriavidus gilardii TaxID=82541 RepID=UPI0034A03769